KSFTVALIVLRIVSSHVFVYAEAPNPYHKRNKLKQSLQKILAEMLVNTNKVALLAVSDFSRDFFQSYGFTANRIYDFGYFRNSVHVSPSPKSSIKEILFVGQLVGRKQVDLVIEALAPILDTTLVF